jgi:hypothetical protein
MNKKLIIVILCILIISAPVWAGGGGGMLLGYQTSRYPFLAQYEVANNSLDLLYYGGYGYGVSWQGSIAGGFGFAIMDVSGASKIAGGFGGFMAGIELIDRPVNLSLVSWTGFGGLSTGIYSADGHDGFFAILEEITLEVGFPIVRWFMPTVYVGYQVAGNVIPGVPFSSFLSYTPVVGFRMQWGNY